MKRSFEVGGRLVSKEECVWGTLSRRDTFWIGSGLVKRSAFETEGGSLSGTVWVGYDWGGALARLPKTPLFS